MKPISLPRIMDSLLAAITVFVILLAVFRLLSKSMLFSVTFSLIPSLAIGVFFYIKSRKKYLIINGKIQSRTKYKQCMHILNVYASDELSSLFRSLFSRMHICDKNMETHMYEGGRYIRLSDVLSAFLAFFPTPLTPNELSLLLASLPNAKKSDNVIVLSESFLAETVAYAKIKNVILLNGEAVFSLLEKYQLTPDITREKTSGNFDALKYVLTQLFTKRNGIKFIVYGMFVFVLSRFVFYPIYYVIIGTVFTLYGLIALFFAKTAALNKCGGDNMLNKFLSTFSKENHNV